ncbi:MAG: hypothetical protein C0582_04785 [Alphaproteobacteria bacterium]|nr:MAG: hypothetical protein C0582_04785 [Alphaproteobacteria bacterium]
MKIFFFYVLLLVFASVDTSGVYISLNGIPVEYPSKQWSNAGTAHVYLQNGGLSSHAFCVQ